MKLSLRRQVALVHLRAKSLYKTFKDSVMGSTEIEIMVKEATNSDPFGPAGTTLIKLSDLVSMNPQYRQEALQTLFTRLELPAENWRKIYKALLVIEYLAENSVKDVGEDLKDPLMFEEIETKVKFKFVDLETGRDEGAQVRAKATALVNLLYESTLHTRRACQKAGRQQEQERAREEQQCQRVSSEDSDVPVISMEILDLNFGPPAAGSFKDVYQARLRRDAPGIGNAGLKVAVLQLRHGTATLAAELQVFKKLGRHPNLTRLLAVVVNDSRNVSSLVTEFAELGSLDNVLMSLEDRGENATAAVLLTAALQTLEAMLQLQEFQIVHCDLALRNLLAFEFHPEETKQVRVKLTDYGLASTDTYVQRATSSVGDGLPFRWMSPEAIQRRRFSAKSDVWAFGVVLWEMFTHGMVPYTLISSDSEVAERVIGGDRLERPLQPTECPDGVFSTMQKCWITQVRDRPTFAHVKNLILQEFVKEGECCICLHKFSLGNLLALIPCGHRCVCPEHAAMVSGGPCPLCRQVVTGAIRVYD